MFSPLPQARYWIALAATLLCVFGSRREAAAIDLTQKSISGSKQFVVYCPDAQLRARVASFADEVKSGVLQMLGEQDYWKHPILLILERAATDQLTQDPVRFSLIQSEVGFKVQIDVRIGTDPAQVHLQKHIARAVLLEFAYRDRPEKVEPGKPWAEAPWWLVEGALQILHTRSRQGSTDADFYKRLIDINHLPPIQDLLQPRQAMPEGSTAMAVDRACALCLVQLLIEQPQGQANLARLVRHLPDALPDPVVALARDFPGLAQNSGELQKWWTVNLARLSAADRFKGTSPEETDAQLASQLQFEIAGKDGAMRSFGVGDFAQYLKLPASKPVLMQAQTVLRELSLNANPLYRDIVAEYEQIFAQLARGKGGGLKERLARVEHFRESLLRRRAEIADYLNWFEATQMDTGSGNFEGYMRAANELAAPARRDDPISRFLDSVEEEFSQEL